MILIPPLFSSFFLSSNPPKREQYGHCALGWSSPLQPRQKKGLESGYASPPKAILRPNQESITEDVDPLGMVLHDMCQVYYSDIPSLASPFEVLSFNPEASGCEREDNQCWNLITWD